jgi:hypothetical protein
LNAGQNPLKSRRLSSKKRLYSLLQTLLLSDLHDSMLKPYFSLRRLKAGLSALHDTFDSLAYLRHVDGTFALLDLA